MKTLIQLFLCLFLFSSFINANENIKSKEIYLQFETYPKRVFTGQKFEVVLKAKILKDPTSYENIVTTVADESDIELLTKSIYWEKQKDGQYKTTLTFKAQDKKFIMPKITLALMKGEEIIDYATSESIAIKYQKIAINQKLFSSIIAKNIKINSVKTKQYSNTQLHNTIEIEGIRSNLEDIKLISYEDQGISDISSSYPFQTVFYYVITPINTKQIDFTYYNTESNEFIKMQVPIILAEELVSTQTELNPYNSSILLYKQSAVAVLLVLFLILYFITKNLNHLIIVSFLIVLMAYLFMPNKKTLLHENTNVYILPTTNSTVYKKLDTKFIVQILNKKNGFVKVLFKNNSIGWVKEHDIK
jgi:hypothetical protein